jgi:hypothetical protein
MANIAGKIRLYSPGHKVRESPGPVKGETVNARGVLEFAKAAGQIDIVPGYKLFTGEYFMKGRIVALDSDRWAEVTGDGLSRLPFVFVAAGEITGGEPAVLECENEENAISFIEMLLEAETKILGG